jgi:cell division protein FtsI/penicillin-binding protein 2
MSPAFASSFRLGLVCFGVLLAFGGIGARLYVLHVVKADDLAILADRARRQIVVQPARRGNIVDQTGNVLAATRPLIELGVDPMVLREEDRSKWPELAGLLQIPLSELEDLMAPRVIRGGSANPDEVRQVRWTRLHESLDEGVYQRVLDLRIRGVYGNRRFVRFYPGQELAAHVLGYLNREETPVTGVERHMDFYLRGQDGWVESERDGRRQELAQFRSREVAPTDGLHVQLTIDMVVQHIV